MRRPRIEHVPERPPVEGNDRIKPLQISPIQLSSSKHQIAKQRRLERKVSLCRSQSSETDRCQHPGFGDGRDLVQFGCLGDFVFVVSGAAQDVRAKVHQLGHGRAAILERFRDLRIQRPGDKVLDALEQIIPNLQSLQCCYCSGSATTPTTLRSGTRSRRRRRPFISRGTHRSDRRTVRRPNNDENNTDAERGTNIHGKQTTTAIGSKQCSHPHHPHKRASVCYSRCYC